MIQNTNINEFGGNSESHELYIRSMEKSTEICVLISTEVDLSSVLLNILQLCRSCSSTTKAYYFTVTNFPLANNLFLKMSNKKEHFFVSLKCNLISRVKLSSLRFWIDCYIMASISSKPNAYN